MMKRIALVLMAASAVVFAGDLGASAANVDSGANVQYPPTTTSTTIVGGGAGTTTLVATTLATTTTLLGGGAGVPTTTLAAPGGGALPATGGGGISTTATVAIGLFIVGLGLLTVAQVRRRQAPLA